MKYLIDFIERSDITRTSIFQQLKCSKDEALILRAMMKNYINGIEEGLVYDLLSELYGNDNYNHLKHLHLIKNLIELGWAVLTGFGHHLKVGESSTLELLHAQIAPSPALLKLLEEGNLDLVLPETKPYTDHLEYLQEQFLRIDLYQKLLAIKRSQSASSPNLSRIKSKLKLLEARIREKVKESKIELQLEHYFKEKNLNEQEQLIVLALLKEEYSGGDENLREMNNLIDLISFDDYERIKNRSLLEESSKLIESGLVDYEEVLTPFGGISRSFFLNDEFLHAVIHPQKKKKKQKIRLETLIKEQEIFELLEPKHGIDEVILNPKTQEMITTILKQVDKSVVALLREWGIKEKKGVDARIIFYGPPGTGKTMTALAIAKALKKQVLSFDCSKILSMYVGESEKNVRKIFDTYEELASKTKSEPLLLLNEADQFLSTRSTGGGGSADKMHNQMQNIFLEQIERFDGLLIATTNLLETIDTAFSRRFNYKIYFEKPNEAQRLKLWEKMLPKNAPKDPNLSLEALARYPLTGGQIQLIIKNCAYKIATQPNAIFTMEALEVEIKREMSSSFEQEKAMGFLS
ncbi:MAG: AAA family ATPase [Campylobacterales bacterium]